MERDKENLRVKMREISLSRFSPGKIAETLRKQAVYRQSRTIFISPAPHLHQIRINTLLDGKVLIMPGPAIKKGFYIFAPYEIAFKDLGHATSLKGIELFGKLFDDKVIQELHVDLALTDCLAVNLLGERLGQGTGFFDLAMGLLAEYGGVDEETIFGAAGVKDQQISEDLPQASWDVKMNFFLYEGQVEQLLSGGQRLCISWDDLEMKRVRKIEPLWQLYKKRF